MKIYIFGFIFLFIQMGFTYGQRGGGAQVSPEERAQKRTEMMTEKLSLSDAQKEKVGAINQQYEKEFADVRSNREEGDWAGMREKMGAIRQKQDEELQTVLTETQWQQWVKIREEEMQKRFQKNKGKQKPKSLD